MRAAAPVLLALLAVAGCGGDDDRPAESGSLTIASPAFRDGGELPERFTCDGEGASPPLRFSGVPGDARDLLLLVDDRDVPVGAFTHWTLWRIAFTPEGTGRVPEEIPPEMVQGANDSGDRGWAPACPPKADGPHHYVFTLYALDEPAQLTEGASSSQVRAAVTASTLAQARVSATYDR